MKHLRHFFRKQKTKRFLWGLLAIAVSFVFLFPLYWLFVSSLKSDTEIFNKNITLWPASVSWLGYKELLLGTNSILSTAKNSFIIAGTAMVLSCLLAIPAAYGLSSFKLPGRGVIIMLFLVTQMLPSSLLLTPLYLNFSKLKLLNNLLAPILGVMTITIPFVLLVLRPMFLSIPKSLEEAALLDGCNVFTAFVRVILPNVLPGVITCACFGFVHGWNDLVYSLTFNTDNTLYPMTTTIYYLMNEFGIRWNWIMAYGVLLAIPPAFIFIFAQKFIVSGITGGAVKG